MLYAEGAVCSGDIVCGTLCKDMCGERIYPLLCRGKYGDIQRVLREIEATFANLALTLIQIGANEVL